MSIGGNDRLGHLFGTRRFMHLLGDYPVRFRRGELLSGRSCSIKGGTDRSDAIIMEVYLVLCYVNTPQVTFFHDLELSRHFQKSLSVILELGG